ncbi:hypothetical protein BDZ97DRAFT_2033184 [Flammula alnicola]|nr:hypothetical protein BDZ97DRAFT_2033184 [Flammula alnicola]
MKFHAKCEGIPMVARVSLIDYRGHIMLDTYVRPTHPVEDYRTSETGLRYLHLCEAPFFVDVQQKVAALIRNKILVGHRIWNFLSVLGLSHSALHTRDLALFRPLRKRLKSHSVVELSTLVRIFMGRNLGFEHEDSLEFSRAAMDLFRSCEEVFEGIIAAGQWPCDLPPSRFAEHFS